MSSEIFIAGLFGLIGGITRAFVGLLKHRSEKIKPGRIAFTLIASGFIGIFCGMLISRDYRLNLLAGYAGTDLVEGIYKAWKNKPIDLWK